MSKILAPLVKVSTFGKIDLDPSTPKLPKANAAPDPDAKEAAKAESRRLQRKKRSGRTSTVLAGGSSKIG
jgi:hypothetical protein